MAETEQPDYTILTVQLLSAYVANNSVPSEDLAGLIQTTRAALVADIVAAPVEVVEHVPAVSVRKSIASRDHILSLIDGRPYKTLKRHLASHGLTPADYRLRYGLPETYPMVAQAYSDQRRAVAQKLGLGQRGTQARAATAAAAAAVSTTPGDSATPVPKRRRRKSVQPDAATPDSTGKAPGKGAARASDAPVSSDIVAAKPAAGKAVPAPTKAGRKPKAQAVAQDAPVLDTPAAPEPVKAKGASKAPARAKAPRKKLGIKAGGTDAAS
ncbi:MucR family transcriptional regulator [Sphingobium sp. CR2-8]|uniref:MucR family transcriptional regulator n=1 Tax=Sphingobium sp. CR2-8 TaxID=1306534 RepID=UPI002DBD3072|nr:MucR family transcriptional regulator [Sphingobium sp. CR2-8]MEC3909260.1 MucR family transcriptional regulator [Sphingobium sp. CR2-8]